LLVTSKCSGWVTALSFFCQVFFIFAAEFFFQRFKGMLFGFFEVRGIVRRLLHWGSFCCSSQYFNECIRASFFM